MDEGKKMTEANRKSCKHIRQRDLPDQTLVNLYSHGYVVGMDKFSDFLSFESREFENDLKNWDHILECHMHFTMANKNALILKDWGKGAWFNVTKPLHSDAELKNKILIIDFFTYCCVNCEHALKFVKSVEQTYKQFYQVQVIGIHSPKFSNEKLDDNVREAVIRNEIEHPVFNDPENITWNKLGIYCWPTVLIISPTQKVLFSLVGEKQIEKLAYLVDRVFRFMSKLKITMDTLPLPIVKEVDSPSSLCFPAGVSICPDPHRITETVKINSTGQRMFLENDIFIVSDTGHHRLIALNCYGTVRDVIGSGIAGLRSCCYTHSFFNYPRGTAVLKELVFVADTGNNSIRLINMVKKKVYTIFNGNNQPDGLSAFSSPWDVCLAPALLSDMSKSDVLYIAVAGSHQIWTMDLKSILQGDYKTPPLVRPFAGSGREECRNNDYLMNAGFAQPSGLSYSSKVPGLLFVADAESSSVRIIDLSSGSVKKCIGGGFDPTDLFVYGDIDGLDRQAKLQHPLGVCVVDHEKIMVADSYNHKVKKYNMVTKKIVTIVGENNNASSSSSENIDLNELKEPSALAFCESINCLVIADTNNHRVLLVDIATNVIKKIPVQIPLRTVVDGPRCNSNSFTSLKLAPRGQIDCAFKFSDYLSPTEGSKQKFSMEILGKAKFHLSCLTNTLCDPSGRPYMTLTSLDDFPSTNNLVKITAEVMACSKRDLTCIPKKIALSLLIEITEKGCNHCDATFVFL